MYDDIDHAEHAAVTAEQEQEQAAELAHEQQRADLIAALFGLSADAADAARRQLTIIGETLDRRGRLGTHAALMLRREAEVAHLAARAAATLDDFRGYDLRGQVHRLLSAATAAQPDGATLSAANRVRATLVEQLGR